MFDAFPCPTLALIMEHKIDIMWMNGKWYAFYNLMHCEGYDLHTVVYDVVDMSLGGNENA